MDKKLLEIMEKAKNEGNVPTFENMPRRNLADKGIAGPTAAHVIEEIHTPFNFAYLTFTTGSSAFQNIVGVTHAELPRKIQASTRILKEAGVKAGDSMLVTYPPLVNVFTKDALKEYGVEWKFLMRSNKEALLSALYEYRPRVILGESSFIKATLEEAKSEGLSEFLPKDVIILTAGTPLNLNLLPVAQEVLSAKVHDLYGCQEFGWLSIDGVPVRDDISLVKLPESELYELVVGGLPMGDSFPVTQEGHIFNPQGKILTYRRERSYPEYEVIVRATTLSDKSTIERVARSILRIKGRVVKVSPDVKLSNEKTVLELRPDAISTGKVQPSVFIEGPEKTLCFDDMVQAQLDYQQKKKSDPTWIKKS